MADSASRSNKVSLKDLRTRIRASRSLDPDLKHRWLEMLPYLSPSERSRLAQILGGDTAVQEEA